jgi:hypothetical protein
MEEKKRKDFADALSNSKYNLDDILNKIISIRQSFFIKGNSEEEEKKFPTEIFKTKNKNGKQVEIPIDQNVYSDLITIIDSMSPALTAPFHHYNNYIDYFIKDFMWDDIKHKKNITNSSDSSVLRKVKYQIEVQSLFISIKIGLDRLVGIFSYYYKGINSNTTFGRKKESGKYRGFMATVNDKKENDSLCKFIFEEYESWIKVAVAPRDIIIHYNDLGLFYEFDSELKIDIPSHYNEKLLKSKGDTSTSYAYTYEHLKKFTEIWLEFIERVYDELIKMDLINYQVRI